MSATLSVVMVPVAVRLGLVRGRRAPRRPKRHRFPNLLLVVVDARLLVVVMIRTIRGLEVMSQRLLAVVLPAPLRRQPHLGSLKG